MSHRSLNESGPLIFQKATVIPAPELSTLPLDSTIRGVAESLIQLGRDSDLDFSRVVSTTAKMWFNTGTTLYDWYVGKKIARRELGLAK
jgi:hypothetical protein